MYKILLVVVLCLGVSVVLAQTNTNEDYGINREGTQKITNGPVIEYVSDHSAMIAWSTKSAAGTYLLYGTDANNLTQRSHKAWGGTNHRLEIQNLQPDTTYYFQVRSENAKGTGDDVQSPVVSFKTVAKGSPPDRQNRNVGVNGSEQGTTTGTSASGASTAGQGSYAPLYRMFGQGDHFYTTSATEHASVAQGGVYKDEGIAGYLASTQVPGSAPLYRLTGKKASFLDHFYTTNQAERQRALQQGYKDEGITGYIATSQSAGTKPLYRMLAQSGDHFYTADENERRSAATRGYRDEGVTGYIWTSASGR